ncbi:hypothetical protein [Bacillus sp. AFS041924]|nr:hypothetical protein [Bacillus sp. AFS041924]
MKTVNKFEWIASKVGITVNKRGEGANKQCAANKKRKSQIKWANAIKF